MRLATAARGKVPAHLSQSGFHLFVDRSRSLSNMLNDSATVDWTVRETGPARAHRVDAARQFLTVLRCSITSDRLLEKPQASPSPDMLTASGTR